jgi:hypothetical protein
MTKSDNQLALGNENSQPTCMCDECRHILPYQKVDVSGVTHHIGYVQNELGTFCYNCCIPTELRIMCNSGKAVLYLVGMKVVNYARTLQFEVDGDIKFITAKLSRNREYQKIRLHFTGPDGARWYGFGFNNQRLTCERMKKQVKNLNPLNPSDYIVHYNYV